MSPLTAPGVNLRLERNFSFSSSACDFLNKNGFDFGKVFTKGVTYLSRTEEEDVRQEFANHAAKNKKHEDIIVSPDDPEIMAF
jgi:poly(A)-specific ribonuclease